MVTRVGELVFNVLWSYVKERDKKYVQVLLGRDTSTHSSFHHHPFTYTLPDAHSQTQTLPPLPP
jgi:hypothetical protein